MSDFLSIVQSLGFPSACMIGMALYIKSEQKYNRQHIEKIEELHNDEVGELRKTVEHNNKLLEKLLIKLGGDVAI
ncbi:MAG: hypothetical protein K2G70_07625 [Turicibacter sp.]|nr:hypothetical protein [Turicibacter sp.]